jgi:hypothetical protein
MLPLMPLLSLLEYRRCTMQTSVYYLSSPQHYPVLSICTLLTPMYNYQHHALVHPPINVDHAHNDISRLRAKQWHHRSHHCTISEATTAGISSAAVKYSAHFYVSLEFAAATQKLKHMCTCQYRWHSQYCASTACCTAHVKGEQCELVASAPCPYQRS